MKKNVLILIIAAALIAGAYFYKFSGERNSDQPIPDRNNTSGGEVTVAYSDSGYAPRELRVKRGTTVIFENRSSNPMWTASDPHPTHTMMDEFDSRRGMMMNESYEFTFSELGTWRYHNHMVPGHMGSVIVE